MRHHAEPALGVIKAIPQLGMCPWLAAVFSHCWPPSQFTHLSYVTHRCAVQTVCIIGDQSMSSPLIDHAPSLRCIYQSM